MFGFLMNSSVKSLQPRAPMRRQRSGGLDLGIYKRNPVRLSADGRVFPRLSFLPALVDSAPQGRILDQLQGDLGSEIFTGEE